MKFASLCSQWKEAVSRNLRFKRRRAARRYAAQPRVCAIEILEDRTLLSSFTVEPLTGLSSDGAELRYFTEHKPQSKSWEYDNTWFAALDGSSGTNIWRLDGTQWNKILTISGATGQADVKASGDKAYVLIQDGSNTKLATLQFQSGSPGSYQLESLTSVPVPSSAEVVTIDIDTTGRMWAAFDDSGKIQVIHSAAPYSSWSSPITLATGVKSDDIAVVVALPNQNAVGVLWSDQSTKRFGFRTHVDGTSPSSWTANEVPASQSALNLGGGMADDHLNVAVASDGTLYAAVKTRYDEGSSSSATLMGLLVRRPNGTWDDLYQVDPVSGDGTRPIVVLNEVQGRIAVFYDTGPIVYRESSTSSISFGPAQTLMSGSNVTSSKASWTDDLVLIASANSVRLVATGTSPTNSPPVLASIGDKSVVAGQNLTFTISATDADGDPLTYSASSLPSGATFNASTRTFSWTPTTSQVGTHRPTFSVTDGQASDSETITITVTDGSTSSSTTVSFQDGVSGYSGTRDTRLRSDFATSNFGTSNKLEVDGNPDQTSLIKWDLSAIPAGSVIESVTIQLNVVNTSGDSFEIYRLLRHWEENQATFEVATNSVDWQAAGAAGSQDRGSTPLGAVTSSTLGLKTFTLNSDGIAAIQAWVNDPSKNFGLIIQNFSNTRTDDFDFSSREASDASQRPKITIRYGTGTSNDPNEAPVLAPIGDKSVEAGQNLTFTISATDADGDPLTYSASNLPSGATFDASTRTFSWTPTTSQTGTHQPTFSVSDGQASDSETITITVTEPAGSTNSAPVLDPIGDKSVVAGQNLTFTISATDADGDPLTYSASSLPSGATFNASTRTFSWTPTTSQVGTHRPTFSVTDGQASDSETITITVTDGSTSSTTVSFQDGVNGYSGTRDTRIREDFATRNFGTSNKLEVDGNPDQASLIKWDLSAIPAGSMIESVTIQLNIVNTSSDSFEIYQVLRNWEENQATFEVATNSVDWTAAGAAGSQDRGSTPLGAVTSSILGLQTFILNGDGVTAFQSWVDDPATNFGLIIQNYTDARTDDFDFSAREANDASQRPKVTITYRSGTATETNDAPVLASIGDKSVEVGQNLTFTISATDADGDPLTYSASNLPSGATFNASTRTFSWTPASSQTGTHQPTFSVSDGQASDSETITITVTEAEGSTNSAPVLDPIGDKSVVAGQNLTFTVSATDADGDPLTYSASNLPSGATFDASTRTFSWTPTSSQTGTYQPTFSVSDGQASDSETITITVADVPGIIVSNASNLKTTESGGTASFSVVLASQPTADVTIAVSSSDTTEGTVNKTLLTFTPTNWNVAQEVIVTGVDDQERDGHITYTIILHPAVSEDPNYNGLDPVDVQITNHDDEKGQPPKNNSGNTSAFETSGSDIQSTDETMLSTEEWFVTV